MQAKMPNHKKVKIKHRIGGQFLISKPLYSFLMKAPHIFQAPFSNWEKHTPARQIPQGDYRKLPSIPVLILYSKILTLGYYYFSSFF
jgi:hypothetical protein